MNGQTPVGRQRLYTQTLMTRGGTGEVEQQTGTLWLMSSTLNAKHRQGETNTHQEGMERQGRTQKGQERAWKSNQKTQNHDNNWYSR